MLVGLIGAVYGLLTYINQLNNMQICNSVTNVLNQTKDNICNKIPDILTIGIVLNNWNSCYNNWNRINN